MDLIFTEDKEIKTPTKTQIEFVLLCCCTCKRPKMLTETLKSINKLFLPTNKRVEVLICDNDENETGKKAIESLTTLLKLPIHYVVEKQRGICFARNKVLEEAIKLNASHILFFDDDEILSENCLMEHIFLYETNPYAFISSGPTKNKFIDNLPKHITKNFVFKQKTSKKTGLKRDYCACGNVFFPISIAKEYKLRFSSEYIFMGGEDGDFFKKASNLGFTIIWNNEAIIYEMISKSRGNIKWILNKCYYNGYAGTILKFKNSNKNKKSYIFKQIITFIANIVILPFSILFGLTLFFNILGICFKIKGKIDGTIKNSPLNFYQTITGE